MSTFNNLPSGDFTRGTVSFGYARRADPAGLIMNLRPDMDECLKRQSKGASSMIRDMCKGWGLSVPVLKRARDEGRVISRGQLVKQQALDDVPGMEGNIRVRTVPPLAGRPCKQSASMSCRYSGVFRAVSTSSTTAQGLYLNISVIAPLSLRPCSVKYFKISPPHECGSMLHPRRELTTASIHFQRMYHAQYGIYCLLRRVQSSVLRAVHSETE